MTSSNKNTAAAAAAPLNYGSLMTNTNDTATTSKMTMSGGALVDKDFDEENFRFVKSPKSEPGKGLDKCCRIGFPIVLALFFMGCAAYFLTRDVFGGFGGGRTFTGTTTTRTSASASASSSLNSSVNHPKQQQQQQHAITAPTMAAAASCSLHEKCATAGLEGVCCPTGDGENLACC
mmetsp:Transcript_5748/g.7554  ORF Transcript_5748/g.7554 Transcript_5748/m.7554 type:complete len:177 (-) Transcript_5748:307-837(-)|eukprot:CAMPEP_0198140988 /NCGR_PEP_ID=MMETSP1443-20131203/4066_1 /TAXON_ID=186043 /ORGANISM="Entomoneis sp., Strain CCMP2396" /LENGTH=176 /DNA_ID=CAMNT_0043803583 /DNA_START=21 /DNA_END=551 /DNA_ORIENTATION=-